MRAGQTVWRANVSRQKRPGQSSRESCKQGICSQATIGFHSMQVWPINRKCLNSRIPFAQSQLAGCRQCSFDGGEERALADPGHPNPAFPVVCCPFQVPASSATTLLWTPPSSPRGLLRELLSVRRRKNRDRSKGQKCRAVEWTTSGLIFDATEKYYLSMTAFILNHPEWR